MSTETKDGTKKYGSAYSARRYDSYHDGEQPGETNDNEHATPQEHEGESDIVSQHGAANHIHVDHTGGTHKVTSRHGDGFEHSVTHGSAKEAYDSAGKLALEAGGVDQASDVKRRTHPDQQGAESEERNYEMPDLA
jgi:hypothetical protein